MLTLFLSTQEKKVKQYLRVQIGEKTIKSGQFTADAVHVLCKDV